jgi:hypothetical protein
LLNVQQGFDRGLGTEGYLHIGGWITYAFDPYFIIDEERGMENAFFHKQGGGFFFALIALLGLVIAPAPLGANPMNQAEFQYDRPGGDYHSYSPAGGWSQCASSCATIAKCRAYTFVTQTGICWLKDKVPKRKASNCCVSGYKVMSNPEINYDRPGSDIKPGFDVDMHMSECENACKNDPKCRAYTLVKPGYQGSRAKCWLKNAKPAKVANPCCHSAIKLVTPPARRIRRNVPLHEESPMQDILHSSP